MNRREVERHHSTPRGAREPVSWNYFSASFPQQSPALDGLEDDPYVGADHEDYAKAESPHRGDAEQNAERRLPKDGDLEVVVAPIPGAFGTAPVYEMGSTVARRLLVISRL